MPANKTKPTAIEFYDSLPARESKMVVRCFWDLAHIARIYPNQARFVIDYAVRHLPEEEAPKVLKDVRRWLEELKRRKAERGRGRPKAENALTVRTRHFQVAILSHGGKLPWPRIASYLGMPKGKPSIRTLTRQRDNYAKLVYKTLLDCGVDPVGKHLNQVLSSKNDSWLDTRDKLEVGCGIPVRKAPAAWAKFAKELFLLAASKSRRRLPPPPRTN